MRNMFSVFGVGPKGFESFSDRLNSRTTVFILSAFAIVIAIRVLVNAPIACHLPSEFSGRQAEYAEQTCWSNKYYIIPVPPEEEFKQSNRQTKPTYHQWIPFLLAFQAFLFHLPKLLWNLGCSYSGTISTHHIQSAALQVSSDRENSTETVSYMARCLGQRLVDLQSSWKTATLAQRFLILLCCNVSSMFHFAAKVLYVINVIGQLFLINVFLGDTDGSYGFSALGRMLRTSNETTWPTSSALPLNVLCEFQIRKIGNIQRYTSQCNLPLNLWYEFMFLFLWSWFVFVAVVTVGSLVVFLLSQLNIHYQERYCRIRLLAMGKANDAQFHQVARFVKDFMTRDTWYFVQQVSRVSGDRTATELVVGLWQYYTEHEENTGTMTSFKESSKIMM